MKKSNLFLLISAGLALIWTLVIGFTYSLAITRDIHGKSTIFTISHSKALEKNIKVFPVPSKQLIISGSGVTSIVIRPGRDFTVKTMPNNAHVSFSKLGNGISVLSLKYIGYTNESVYITLPEELPVKVRHLNHVTITGFSGGNINFELSGIDGFAAEKCTLSHLAVNVLHKVDNTDVTIGNDCKVDTLMISMPGCGHLNLESSKITKKMINISDSVVVASAGSH